MEATLFWVESTLCGIGYGLVGVVHPITGVGDHPPTGTHNPKTRTGYRGVAGCLTRIFKCLTPRSVRAEFTPC